MDLNKKNILVMGLGISGVSTIRVLNGLGAKIFVTDGKSKEELKEMLKLIEDIQIENYFDNKYLDLRDIDLIIKSPGIPPNNDLLLRAIDKNIKVINDIELGSNLSSSKNILAITGTNGKTTSTTMLGHIFKADGYNTSIGGNIGNSILKDMVDAKEEDIFIIEMSSFQLQHTVNLKPYISLILNITPDHLDWHGNYENYIKAKKKIFKNQDSEDYTVLNYDDKILKSFENEIKSNIVWFSMKKELDNGVFIKDNNIFIRLNNEEINLLPIDKLLLKGKHNLENILGVVAVSFLMGVSIDKIRDELLNFKGVEHRLEFVTEKNGRSFFNDSKGTNINSSIKAIEAIDEPIILIAGGYDKKIEFDSFILSFDGKVKSLVLLGATGMKIKETALKLGFNESFIVDSMEEAVNLAYSLSKAGDNILLSPACASWGMFKNFEERGGVFKQVVGRLGED